MTAETRRTGAHREEQGDEGGQGLLIGRRWPWLVLAVALGWAIRAWVSLSAACEDGADGKASTCDLESEAYSDWGNAVRVGVLVGLVSVGTAFALPSGTERRAGIILGLAATLATASSLLAMAGLV